MFYFIAFQLMNFTVFVFNFFYQRHDQKWGDIGRKLNKLMKSYETWLQKIYAAGF